MQIRVKWMESEHVLRLDLAAMCEWIQHQTENRINRTYRTRTYRVVYPKADGKLLRMYEKKIAFE